MASSSLLLVLVSTLLCSLALGPSSASGPRELHLVRRQPLVLRFHNGRLLKGNYTLNLIFYGSFTPPQRAVLADFVESLGAEASRPSIASWWRTTERYNGGSTRIVLGRSTLLRSYRLGRRLTREQILKLASVGPHRDAINVVLTAADVAVEGFCSSTCGFHSSAPAGKHGKQRFAYMWVGNSAEQCPGRCAWPFHQPVYGPQTPALVPPNGEVGIDGMVINLATLLAGTVTNPFEGGFFQGPKEAPLEAVSACPGVFGKGAYPGYPGELLVDAGTRASYNAVGLYGRKYLLPAMWDPKTLRCSAPV